MSDPAAAICTSARVKQILNISASTWDTQFETLIGVVASLAERVCGRTFICSCDVTEYYTIDCEKNFFYANRKPIISITSLYEDATCKYGSDTLLVKDTTTVYGDYLYHTSSGRIERIDGCWAQGTNAIKLTYQGGYATTSALVSADPALAESAAELASWMFERTKAAAGGGRIGISAKAKGDGSISFDDEEPWERAQRVFAPWKHNTDIGF